MSTYAGAKAAYKELRDAIGPWAKANGFLRTKGTQANWEKPVDPDQLLRFMFEGYSMVNPDTGNSYHGYVQLEPRVTSTGEIVRQSSFSCCLVQAELDELARVQGAINARRPPLPDYLRDHFDRDTILGHGLREEYDPAPKCREGEIVYFRYHSLDDARDLAAFIARVLPQALDCFLQGRVVKPISTTPPHLIPKFFRSLGDKP